MYFIQFKGETIQEAIKVHGGLSGGYDTKEKALIDAIVTGYNMPFIILNKVMKVVHKEPDYE